MPLRTQLKSTSQQQLTPTYHQCHISLHISRELSHQLKASTARHKKATKDAGPNSHAIQKLVEKILLKPLEPPYPRSYNPNARCSYHDRAVGHATERYWSLKHKVQDLLDGRLLDFQD
ncbi:hypothetical protein CR513_03707, partial [Mucuna pruriens]